MNTSVDIFQLNNLDKLSLKNFPIDNNITVNLTNTNIFKNDTEYLVKFLSTNEKNHSSKIPLEAVRERFIIHRALLRLQLATYLDQSPSKIPLETNEFGKPSIRRRCNNFDIQFNISHCENYAVFAFNKNYEIGIDIEEDRSFPSLLTMASIVLAPSEIAELKALPTLEQNRKFLNLWTKKEAISKAFGQGLNMNFKELNLGFQNASQKVFCQTHGLDLVDISHPPLFHASLARIT